MKKTKIICTLGPVSSEPEIVEQLVNTGMNIARLNFSHDTHTEHARRIQAVRQVSAKLNKPLGVLADIQGPKIRIGVLAKEPLLLKEEERVFLTVNEAKRSKERHVFIDYPTLIQDVKIEGLVYLADGMICLQVVARQDEDTLECSVVSGGELTSKKGVTLPGVSVNLPAMMEKDRRDIAFTVEQEVDFIAVSFARKAEHIEEIRQYVNGLGGDQMLIAKIENEEGYHNCEEILKAADGIMVARGDLGIEVLPEEVPIIQQHLISLCNRMGKPVITATEMLESMIRNPRPTRAEITDIAHAIYDGTDAIMLSAETTVGKYPIAAVDIMNRVSLQIEKTLKYEVIFSKKKIFSIRDVSDAISHATCQTALDLNAAAIVTSTLSGSTARMVSKYRPRSPIVAATPSWRVGQKLALSWGVIPIVVPNSNDTDSMINVSVAAALKTGFIDQNDLIVITSGARTGLTGSTNLMKVHCVE